MNLLPISPRSSRRRAVRGVAMIAAAAATLVLSACAGTNSNPDSTEAVEGGTLRIDGPMDAGANPCLDPFQGWGSDWTLLTSNIAERLVDQHPETGEIVPWLASGWEISEDGLNYTFTLQEGVTFSDGSAFNAEAVKTAYDADLALLEENPGVLGGADIAGLESITVDDEYTVTLTLDQPNASFLNRLSWNRLGILSPASYELSAQERCEVGISSTAAFEVTEFTPYESIVFSARGDYTPTSTLNTHDGPAHLDTIEYYFVGENSVRVGNLTSGASDIAWKVNPYSPTDLEQFAANGNITLEQRSMPGTTYFYWTNTAAERPLSDKNIRLAVLHALDNETYADVLYGEDYPDLTGMYDSSTSLTEPADASLYAYDPELSAQLLEESGWELGEDGYRVKDGERLTIEALSYGTDPVGEALLQSQLKEVGIDLQLIEVPAAELVALENAGEFDIAYGYFNGSDPITLFRFYNQPGAGGLRGLDEDTTAAIIDLMDANLAAADDEERLALTNELQTLMLEEGLILPIFDRMQQAAVSDQVGGFQFTAESVIRFHDLWLNQ
ncbi:MAG: ABC transporter substrate-binding protein [Gulosibacter sp.]|uniref:ABC transporter substrate-binding protein n=1 Tax=Gulosibacter sp. TaxID=2817531 RepID=UPI003F938EE9